MKKCTELFGELCNKKLEMVNEDNLKNRDIINLKLDAIMITLDNLTKRLREKE